MNIQPIVEAAGEVGSVPVLLRRLQESANAYSFGINPPIRKPQADFREQSRLELAIRLARKQEGCGAVLLLIDGDGKDDCPKTDGPRIQEWAAAAAAPLPCAVVIAYREYEAWFLAAIESLRGTRGVLPDAVSHPEPEVPRGAKKHLQERIDPQRTYSERADQPAMTAVFDMAAAYRRCRSFRRFVKVFGELATALDEPIAAPWPPNEWALEFPPEV